MTIIATGLNIEQQNEIVNTKTKKIIHTLEDEQRSVHNLTNKTVAAFDLNTESPASNSTERIVFDLLEDTVVVPEPVTAAPIIIMTS